MSVRSRILVIVAAALVAVATIGCGGSNTPKAPPGVSQSAFERQLADAQRVRAADFPVTQGKTLQEVADLASPGHQVALATSVFVPGANRLAFGVLDTANRFVYGKTAVYVGRSGQTKAQGPYVAPADSLLTEGRYRSKQAALEASPIASIYAALVPLKRPGRYAVLVLTKTSQGLVRGTAQIRVRRDTTIPGVRERPPSVSTDTSASAGTEQAVDTRIPTAPELHKTSLKDVLGKRPVADPAALPIARVRAGR